MNLEKVSKVTKALIYLSVIATVLDLSIGNFSWKTSLLYLILNLSLAWIPYIISSCFVKKDMPMKRFVPVFIFWILFFPNAPYLATDVLHLAGRVSPLLWYESLLFFFFGWIGLMLGMLSLRQIHEYLKAHLGRTRSEFVVFAICFISGFGIYLGRFGRWNSWDIIFSPLKFIQAPLTVSARIAGNATPLLFTVVFTVFIYSIYKTVDVIAGI